MSKNYFEAAIANRFASRNHRITFWHKAGLYVAEIVGEGIRITGRPNSRRVTANWGSGHCAQFSL